jgi:hypothetical protein
MSTSLFEGGNVFKDANGRAVTQRINQTDVDPTVTWLEELTGLDLHGELDPDTADESHPHGYPERWLGSTGKKESSGDLDLGIDANKFSKDQMGTRRSQWCQSHGFKPEDYVREDQARIFKQGDPYSHLTDYMHRRVFTAKILNVVDALR